MRIGMMRNQLVEGRRLVIGGVEILSKGCQVIPMQMLLHHGCFAGAAGLGRFRQTLSDNIWVIGVSAFFCWSRSERC